MFIIALSSLLKHVETQTRGDIDEKFDNACDLLLLSKAYDVTLRNSGVTMLALFNQREVSILLVSSDCTITSLMLYWLVLTIGRFLSRGSFLADISERQGYVRLF